MHTTDYLIAGSSHAALEAINAIRMHDGEGAITVVTRDPHRPYSPTVLPYVVSGRSTPERVYLRDDDFFAHNKVDYRSGCALAGIDPAAHQARLADGSTIAYRKLLLATGASPVVPPIPGIDRVDYHVLRTLDDATRLRAAMAGSKTWGWSATTVSARCSTSCRASIRRPARPLPENSTPRLPRSRTPWFW